MYKIWWKKECERGAEGLLERQATSKSCYPRIPRNLVCVHLGNDEPGEMFSSDK